MTSDDNRHADQVRGRLDAAIAEIPAPPAPLAVVVRKGRVMRVRRRAVVAAAVAIAAAAAAVTPGIVHELTRSVPAAKPPKITVETLGRRAVNGVIAAGMINGKRWQLRLTTQGGGANCWSPPGSRWAPNMRCQQGVGFLLQRRRGVGEPVAILTFLPVLFGPVNPAVTRVTMRMTDGAVLNLRPVEAFGHRWIGIVLPAGLAPAKAVAYSRHGEIEHSVPYVNLGTSGGGPTVEFLTWLPPGDDGPARVTKTIRGGGVTAVLHAGPWGNVINFPGQSKDFPLNDHPSGALWFSGGLPRSVPMAFPWPAAYIKLSMSDGSTRTVRIVEGAGLGFAIVRAPKNPHIMRWDVYAADGRRLTGGIGSPGG